MARAFLYLAAVVDWYSRRVLAWRLSISMDTVFCMDVLEEALQRYGTPQILNADQGSQFTSEAFTGLLKQHGIAPRQAGPRLGFLLSAQSPGGYRNRRREVNGAAPDRSMGPRRAPTHHGTPATTGVESTQCVEERAIP